MEGRQSTCSESRRARLQSLTGPSGSFLCSDERRSGHPAGPDARRATIALSPGPRRAITTVAYLDDVPECACAQLPDWIPDVRLADVSALAGEVEPVVVTEGTAVYRCSTCGQHWEDGFGTGQGVAKVPGP